jgi:hypothetical protein
MKVASLFRPGTRAFWGTTYGFGLALFDQYLLRQLGGPPPSLPSCREAPAPQ